MTITYFTATGRTVRFDRDTLDECIAAYYRRRRSVGRGVHWGHYYQDGKRVWLS